MIIHLKMIYDTNKLLICIIIISCPSCYSQCDKSFVKTENYDKVEGLNPFPKENHTKTDLLDADCKEDQITEEMVTTIEPTKPADDHTIDIYNNTTVYDPITTRESSETTFTTVGTSISTIPSNLDEAAKNHSVIITAFSETNIPTQVKTDFSETTSISEPTKATIFIDITQNTSVLDETTITTAEISETTFIENTSTLLSDETPRTTAETSKTTLNMDTTIEYDDPPLIFDFSTPKTEVDVISLAPFSTTIDTTVTSLTGILVSATEMESEEAIDTIDPTLYNPTQSIQYNMTQTTSLTTVEPNDTTHRISTSTTEMSEMPPNISTTITDSTVTTLDIYTSITESYEKSHIMTDSPFYSTSRTTENTVSTVVTEPSEVIITGITQNITTPQTDQLSTTEEIITTSKFSPKQEILTTLTKPGETTKNYFAITTEPNETQNNSMSTTRTLETTQNVEFLPPVTINEISTIEPDIYENTTVPTRTTEYELPFLEATSKEIGYTPPFTKNGTRRGRTDRKWSTSKFRTTKKINPITKMPKYKPTVRPSPKSSTKSPITTNKTNNVGNTGKNNTLVTTSADNDIRRTNFSFNVGKEEKEEIKYRRVTCDRTTTPTKILAMSVGASVTGIFIFTLKFFMQRNCKAVVKFFEP